MAARAPLRFQAVRDRRDQQLAHVIDTAARLFAQNGFGHTGMAELCDVLAMGRGQLYHLIGSKENLLKLVHERFTVLLFEGAARIEAMDLPPAERLRHLIRDLIGIIAAHQDYVWVFFNEWRVLGEVNRDEYRQRRRNYQDKWERVLSEGNESGEFSIPDTHLAVLGILGMVNYSYQWLKPDGAKTPTEIADIFSGMILAGIQKRGRESARAKSAARLA